MDIPLSPNHRLSPARQNECLFSDHILDNVVPTHPAWERGLVEAEGFLTWLRRRYAREWKSLADYRERGLDGHWFRPILRRLGHVFTPQPPTPDTDNEAKRPDYVLFPDQASRRAVDETPDRGTLSERALLVAEMKRWETPLGKKPWAGGVGFEDQNPSWQIAELVSTTGVRWGLLTNGRLWRLVHRDTADRLDTYYQVDLVTMMEHGDPEELLHFTLFFRQAAFLPDERGEVFLEELLTRSRSYARGLERDLRKNARLALQRLMQGFLEHAPNRLGQSDLDDVYENSLYFLYRLLFILCGESRGLLPVHYEQYRSQHSLARIVEEIAELDAQPSGTTLYWGQLKNLFQIVNGNYPKLNWALGVPRYNGALFDPEQHRFLEENAVGDRDLVEVIDLLSRRRTEAGVESVDYRTLSAGHVGSIYEPLLACQPRQAKEPMVAVATGAGHRWVPAAEAPDSAPVAGRREKGQVYLESHDDDGAADMTYAPEASVVEAAVERTVGPILARAISGAERAPTERSDQAGDSPTGPRIVEEVLALRVLDPAMGSGRLLVETTDFLARALTTDPRVRAAEADEDDLSYWRRRVVERCIYGVDRDPLAVELAKLSLWLSTVAADRPLSFLDHHLVHGDSLIGARVEDLGWPPPAILEKEARRQAAQQRAGQINMFDHLLRQTLPGVVERVLEITQQESRDYETVQAKQAADRSAQRLRAPFEAVADLWVSAYFGNGFARGDYEEAMGVISQPNLLLALDPVRRARQIGERRAFFHWELTFPEVFYDERGRPLGNEAGFDAVVSDTLWHQNPSSDEEAFLEAVGLDAGSTGDALASVLFAERGERLLTETGRLGLLLPNAVPKETAHELCQSPARDERKVVEIVNLGEGLDAEELDGEGDNAGGVDAEGVGRTCFLLVSASSEGLESSCLYPPARDGKNNQAP